MNYFLDASALVKRYVREAGSDQVQSLIKKRPLLIVSRLTAVEVPSALWKRSRAGDLTSGEARRLAAKFSTDFDQLTSIEPRGPTLDLAAGLVEQHPLRAYDAVQLASALRWTRETRLAVTFVCADRTLASAARKERIRAMLVSDRE